jgi:DNA polymerase I
MVTFCDSYEERYWTFAWHPRYRKQVIETNYPKRITIHSEAAPWTIRVAANEREMMQDAIDFLRKEDPDLLTGWNVQDFDMPYLSARCDQINVDFNRISPMGKVTILEEHKKKKKKKGKSGKSKVSVKVWGRIVVDQLAAYRLMHTHELDSFQLEDIGQFEFGVGKVKLKKGVGRTWEDHFKRALYYNCADVELCYEIDRKRKVIPFLDYERRFTGCEFDDSMARSRIVDVTLLREAQDLHIALPSKVYGRVHKKFKGGKVLRSRPGKYRNVMVIDFAAFYPSLLIALNASMEYKVTDKKLRAMLEKIHQFYFLLPIFAPMVGKVPRFPKFPFTRSANGVWFFDHEDSLVRRVIGKFLKRRKGMKVTRDQHRVVGICDVCSTVAECNELYRIYDDMQKAYKTRINTYYGVSGYVNFRLYDREAAQAITLTAQALLLYTEKIVHSKEMYRAILEHFPHYNITEPPEIVYGDTDSTFLRLPANLTIEQCVEVSQFIVERLNRAYLRLLSRYHFQREKFGIEMGAETLFDPLIFVEKKKTKKGAKKKYAGRVRWKDGKLVDYIVKKGFKSVRADASAVSKGAQDRCIRLICYGVDAETIAKGVKKIIHRIRKGRYKIEEVSIPKGVRVDPDDYELGQKSLPHHVRAVLTSEKYWELEVRDKVLLCYFKVGEEIKWGGRTITLIRGINDVFAFQRSRDVPEGFKKQIDYDALIEKTLKSDLEQILALEGVQWDRYFTNQTSLDAWMSA